MWAKTVARDRVWFSGTEGLREKFWEDVASARVGTFAVPEPVRPRGAAAAATGKLQVIVQKESAPPPKACLILDDEE
jgi:hypothetical protein